MAVFVSMDKSVVVDPGFVTFVSATNSQTYRYRVEDAEKVFTANGFDSVDAKSMLEMTALNHEGEDNVLSENELQAGAAGLVDWKQHERAREEEEKARKAEEALKARVEYEEAKAAAEEEERKKKAAEAAAAAAAAAASESAAKPNKKAGFFSRAKAMAEDVAKVAKKAGEVAFYEGEKLYNERKKKLKELKAKLEAAEASAGEAAEPEKRLTFYEQAMLKAGKVEKSLDDYRQMTDSAVSKGLHTGEQEWKKLQQDREASGNE